MTNKKFKLAAMSLATAVAVSTVGPSASAVTYYLGDGSVTVDQDGNGAFSYQVKEGESADGSDSNRTYVNEDKEDNGVINVRDATRQRKKSRQPLITPITPTMAQRYPHLRIMTHNPPMLLATTQRTVPRLRPQPQTPSRSKRM